MLRELIESMESVIVDTKTSIKRVCSLCGCGVISERFLCNAKLGGFF